MLRPAPTSTRILPLLICLAVLWSANPVSAVDAMNDNHFDALQKRLIKDGFQPETIAALYSRPQVFFETNGATLLFTYSEGKLDYDQFANDWSIRKAKDYMQKYREDLERTEKTYGVDSRIITAILLVETGLGASVGTRSALNSLSTIAALMEPEVRDMLWESIPEEKRISRKDFDQKAERRSKWAYAELKAFLTYAQREGFDPAEIPGSFAGAVGLAQFMPTNIIAYGKDGNADGIVDLLVPADSMASIANFLKRHGWQPGISRVKAEKVIYHYNHSEYYVAVILKIAALLKS